MEKVEELAKILDEEEIEKEALRCYHLANQERFRGDLEAARTNLGIAWGFARYNEDVQMMARFRRSFKNVGLTNKGIVLYQNRGYDEVLRILQSRKEAKI